MSERKIQLILGNCLDCDLFPKKMKYIGGGDQGEVYEIKCGDDTDKVIKYIKPSVYNKETFKMEVNLARKTSNLGYGPTIICAVEYEEYSKSNEEEEEEDEEEDEDENEEDYKNDKEEGVKGGIIIMENAGKPLKYYIDNDLLSKEEYNDLYKKLKNIISILHENNIYHNDLSSNNILLKERTAKKYDINIIDFGNGDTKELPEDLNENNDDNIIVDIFENIFENID